jgi:DNA-binding NtrC family response regulator
MIRAIVADDEPSLLEIAKRFLEKEGGFEIDTASTAQEALTLLRGGVYDAVVSGYRMSDMDRLQFLKTLRERGNEIPFILSTGHGREEEAMVICEDDGAGIRWDLKGDIFERKRGSPEGDTDST